MDAFIGNKKKEKQGNGYPKCKDTIWGQSEGKGRI